LKERVGNREGSRASEIFLVSVRTSAND